MITRSNPLDNQRLEKRASAILFMSRNLEPFCRVWHCGILGKGKLYEENNQIVVSSRRYLIFKRYDFYTTLGRAYSMGWRPLND